MTVVIGESCSGPCVNEWAWPCANKTLFTKTGLEQIVTPDLEEGSMGVHCHRLATSVGLKYFQSQKMSEENVDFLTLWSDYGL